MILVKSWVVVVVACKLVSIMKLTINRWRLDIIRTAELKRALIVELQICLQWLCGRKCDSIWLSGSRTRGGLIWQWLWILLDDRINIDRLHCLMLYLKTLPKSIYICSNLSLSQFIDTISFHYWNKKQRLLTYHTSSSISNFAWFSIKLARILSYPSAVHSIISLNFHFYLISSSLFSSIFSPCTPLFWIFSGPFSLKPFWPIFYKYSRFFYCKPFRTSSYSCFFRRICINYSGSSFRFAASYSSSIS